MNIIIRGVAVDKNGNPRDKIISLVEHENVKDAIRAFGYDPDKVEYDIK